MKVDNAVSEAERYVLCLYITGISRHSAQALYNIKEICEQYLEGRYQLNVVDICQQPELAGALRLLATPTLVKESPAPARRLVGNMSQKEHVLRVLGILPELEPEPILEETAFSRGQ